MTARWPLHADRCNAVLSLIWRSTPGPSLVTRPRSHGTGSRRAGSRLTFVAFTAALESRRSRTHPSCPYAEETIRAVHSATCNDTISKMRRDEHRAGGRRAPYVEEACAKLGGAAGRRHSQPARAPCRSLAMGRWRRVWRAPCRRRGRPRKHQRRRGRGRPREAHAAAHLRIVPVDVPSALDQPPELRLVAVPCGIPQFLGLGGTEPAHVFCAVSAAREGRPTSSLTRNRSEIVRPPSPQRCEACRAPRGRFDSRANSMLDEGCLPAGLPSWP